uniref:Uncharacterized protein n=1 Tax=uncultured Alphaproteobacteria bacterium TaxID=91750 RepID=A0A6G8F2M0_9PROT|nr:hypothetical protein PlAlph_4060 [uncultured Alphaproteobacteria bacterium]
METIVIIIAILALIVCLIKAANSAKPQKWSIAAWIIAVFLFGAFFNDITELCEITGMIAKTILVTIVLGIASIFLWRLAQKL